MHGEYKKDTERAKQKNEECGEQTKIGDIDLRNSAASEIANSLRKAMLRTVSPSYLLKFMHLI